MLLPTVLLFHKPSNFTHFLVLVSLIPSFELQVHSLEHWYLLHARMPQGKRASGGGRACVQISRGWGLSDGTLAAIKLWGHCTSKPSTATLTIEKCMVFPSFRNCSPLLLSLCPIHRFKSLLSVCVWHFCYNYHSWGSLKYWGWCKAEPN